MLAALWKSVQSQQIKRLNVLKQMLQHFHSTQIPDDVRQAGYRAAHGLTGALGIFGLRTGSDMAREIQELLADEAAISSTVSTAVRDRLAGLIQQLEAAINHAIQDSAPVPQDSELPLLVLVDPQLHLTSALVSALWERGLAVKILPNFKAFQNLAGILQQVQEKPPADKLSAQETFPDVALLDFSLQAADSAQLQWLSALADKIPSLMLVVCSSDGSLSNRIKASQLGSYPFLYNPNITAVVEGVTLLRSNLKKHTCKILMVDDDPQVLAALRSRLESHGFEIVTLSKTVDFWNTLQTAAPDLLLLDILMPEVSGIELCQAVRQAPSWSHLPIVFFTAQSDTHIQQSAFRAGANDLVEKSSPHSELLSHLYSQIRRSHLQQAISAIANSTSTLSL